MKYSAITLIAFFLVLVYSQNKETILALTWLSGYCEENQCSPYAIHAWDHQSFTIHGLWPQKKATNNYGSYNRRLISGNLQDIMLNYWPPQTRTRGKADFLWYHEFSNHGADFCEIYYNDHQAQFSGLSVYQRNNQLHNTYFTYTVDLYNNLKVRKIPKSNYKKGDFAKLLGIKQTEFSIICTDSGNISEIRICYDIKAAGAVVSPCKTGVINKKCKLNSFTLGDWKQNASPSTRVINS